MDNDTLIFTADDGEEREFEIIADTVISGVTYLLVSTGADEDGEEEAIILKEVSQDEEEASYVILEDPVQLEAVARVFEEDNDLDIL